MDISFKLDPETFIGTETLSMAGTICRRYGDKIMVAADNALDSRIVTRLTTILEDSGIEVIIFDGVQEDCGIEMAENIVELARSAHCTAVLGFGGIKTLTVARLAAVMAPLRASIFELLEGRKIQSKFLPFIAIPTSGIDIFTFTNFIVLIDPRDRLIKQVTTPDKQCAAVIIDGNIANYSSKSAFIFDGFCTSMEAYCSTKSNFLSDSLLERSITMYVKMIKTGAAAITPEAMAQAEFLASLGAALSSPGFSAALALSVTARYPVSKQQCTAILLPAIAQKLITARPEKMARIASFLGIAKDASVADSAKSTVDTLRRFLDLHKIPQNLKEFNISLDKIMASSESARNLEFIANSPWIISTEDVFEMLKQIV
jgi:alcohol dehydrogenase